MKTKEIDSSTFTWLGVVLAVAALMLLLVAVRPTQAAPLSSSTITVSTCDQASLKTAVSTAAAGDTINFSCSGTIVITPSLVITKILTLDGSNQAVTLSGGGVSQIINASSPLTVTNLTLTNGKTSGNGGAITTGSNLVINNSSFISNTATGNGGGIFLNGSGFLKVTNSTFISNSASNTTSGGGIYISGSGAFLVLTNSTFISNTARQGAGLNISSTSSAGTQITNSTFYTNTASSRGGAIYAGRTITLTNVTIANNASPNEGIYVPNGANIQNSIIVSNTTANCGGTITDGGYNIDSGTSCSFSNNNNSQSSVTSPGLDTTIKNNGGSTKTLALLSGSPAINKIPATGANCPATDQRGTIRPQGTNCDIGAFEYPAPSVSLTSPPLPDGYKGVTYSQQLTATGGTAPYTYTVTGGSLPTGLSLTSSGQITGTPGIAATSFFTVTATDSDLFTGGSQPYSITIQPVADVQLSKTVDNPSPLAGQEVSFTITATNAGPDNATGVVITDTMSPGLSYVSSSASPGTSYSSGTWTIGTITSTSYVTLTVVAQVTASGLQSNVAAKSAEDEYDTNTSNDSSEATLNAVPVADLTVVKTGPPTAIAGDNVTYVITVTNNGPDTATGITLTDTLPANTTDPSITPSSGCTTDSPPTAEVCTIASLESGASQVYTLTVSTDPDAFNLAPLLTNTAVVTTSTTPDINPLNNSSAVTTTLTAQADLSIVKQHIGPVTAGEPVTYTITITNTGPSAINSATVTDTFPLALSGVTYTCTASGTATTCPSGSSGDISSALFDIGPSGQVIITATGTLNSAASGTLSNTATVGITSGYGTDPNPVNNSSTDTTPIGQSADLSISKTHSDSTFLPGDPITYTIVITNSGPGDVSGAGVFDTVPVEINNAGWTCSASGGATCTNPTGSGNISTTLDLPSGTSATYMLIGTIASNASGTFTNTASVEVSGEVTDPNTPNNTASDPVTLNALSSDLSITKTHSGGTFSGGDPVTYTIVIANAGPQGVSGAAVLDSLPAEINGASWVCNASGGSSCHNLTGSGSISGTLDLPSGTSATFVLTGNISANYSGVFTNTASVEVPNGISDPNISNNTASDPVSVNVNVSDLAITKTHTGDSFDPGSSIVYTITVSNNGPDTANGVSVTDILPAELIGASWTCSPTPGSFCGNTNNNTIKNFKEDNNQGCIAAINTLCGSDSGTGNISATLDLPSGGSITFVLTATIGANATGTFVNTASVSPPAGTFDPNSANNTASDPVPLNGSAPPPKPRPRPQVKPANFTAQLRVNPDRVVAISEASDITYTLTIVNTGPGVAKSTKIYFPTDLNIFIGYAVINDAGVYVSRVVPANGTTEGMVEITFTGEISVNQSFSIQVVFHPLANAADGTKVFSHFQVTWNDDEEIGKQAGSNGVRYTLSSQPASSFNQTNGQVQLFSPASAKLANGQSLDITGDFFGPNEIVNLWYTDGASNSFSLGVVKADSEGRISFNFTALGLTPGSTYTVAGYGNLSGVYGSSVITITTE